MIYEQPLAVIELRDAAATSAFGECLGARLVDGDFVALIGDLGAGKTTLTRGLARGLSVDDPDAVASPTYLLVVEHDGPVPLRHVDAYFAARTRSFLDDGGGSWLAEAAGVTVVEWADRIADLLPSERLELRLSPSGGGRRVLVFGAARFARTAEFLAERFGH